MANRVCDFLCQNVFNNGASLVIWVIDISDVRLWLLFFFKVRSYAITVDLKSRTKINSFRILVKYSLLLMDIVSMQCVSVALS